MSASTVICKVSAGRANGHDILITADISVNGANFGAHSASIYVKVGNTYSAKVLRTSDSSLQSLVPSAASKQGDSDDVMCSTAVFANPTAFAATNDCEDDVDFDVGHGGCNTYASYPNAGWCQADGACNACG